MSLVTFSSYSWLLDGDLTCSELLWQRLGLLLRNLHYVCSPSFSLVGCFSDDLSCWSNHRMCYTVCVIQYVIQSLIALTFSGSADIPSLLITWPKKHNFSQKNLYFDGFNFRLNLSRYANTFWRSAMGYFAEFEWTTTSSIYTIHIVDNRSLNLIRIPLFFGTMHWHWWYQTGDDSTHKTLAIQHWTQCILLMICRVLTAGILASGPRMRTFSFFEGFHQFIIKMCQMLQVEVWKGLNIVLQVWFHFFNRREYTYIYKQQEYYLCTLLHFICDT